MLKPNVQAILSQLNLEHSFVAKSMISKDFIAFSDKKLQAFFDGGLPRGELSEWGMRNGGRDVLLDALTAATANGLWSLWIRPQGAAEIYPPAWSARGVKLDKVRFAYTDQPVADLKPLFMDPFFKFIVIDEPKQLSVDDCSFLARRAQEQKQSICIIRPYFLSPKRGNVWTKLRVNLWRPQVSGGLSLQVIKGLSPRQMCIADST